jgi:hypothetical protein
MIFSFLIEYPLLMKHIFIFRRSYGAYVAKIVRMTYVSNSMNMSI